MAAESSQAQIPCTHCGQPNGLDALRCSSCHAWLADALLSEPLARRIGLELLSDTLSRLHPDPSDPQRSLAELQQQISDELSLLRQQTRAELLTALRVRRVSALPPEAQPLEVQATESDVLRIDAPPQQAVLLEEVPVVAAVSEASMQEALEPAVHSSLSLGATGAALPKLSLPPPLALPPKLTVHRRIADAEGDVRPSPSEAMPERSTPPSIASPVVAPPVVVSPPTREPPRPRRTFQLPVSSSQAAASAPSGWEVLQRLKAEHVVWGLGVLLTLVGSFYFVGSRWGSFSSLMQEGILLGGGLIYSGAFWAIGRLLAGRSGLELASRVMATVSLALWPGLALPIGRLLESAPGWGLLALSLAAGTGWMLHTRAILLISPADVPTFARVYLPLSLLPALLPMLEKVGLAGVLPFLGMVGLYRALFVHNISEGRQRLERSWALALSTQAFGVVCALTLSRTGVQAKSLLPLLPLLGAGAFYLDLALGRWRGIQRIYFKEPPGILGLLLTLGGVLSSLDGARGLTPPLTQLFGGLVLGLVALLYRARWLLLGVQGITLALTFSLGKSLGLHSWLARLLELSPSSGQMLALSLLPGLPLLMGIERLWQRLERPQFAEDTRYGALVVSGGIGLLAVSGSAHWPWILVLPACAATCASVFRRTAQREPLLLAWAAIWLFAWRSLGALELPPGLAVLLALGADALGARLATRTFLPLGETSRAMSLGGLGVGLALSLGLNGLEGLHLPSVAELALNLTLLGTGMALLAYHRHPRAEILLKGAIGLTCLGGISVPLGHALLPVAAGDLLSIRAILALTLGAATLFGVALLQSRQSAATLLGQEPSSKSGRIPWASASFTLGLSGALSILAWAFLPGVIPEGMTRLRSLLSPWVSLPQPLTVAWLAFFFWPLTAVWLGLARALERWQIPGLVHDAALGLGSGLALLAVGSVLTDTPLPSLVGLPLLLLTAWGLSSSALPTLSRPLIHALTGLRYALGVLLVLQAMTALDFGLASKTLVLTLTGVLGLEWSVRRPGSSLHRVRGRAGTALLWLTLALAGSALLLGTGADQLPLALAFLGAGMSWSAARARAIQPEQEAADQDDQTPLATEPSPLRGMEQALELGGWLISLGAAGLSVVHILMTGGGWLGTGAALLAAVTAVSSSMGLGSIARLLLFYPLLGVAALSVARADPVAAARNEALVAQALGYSSGKLPLGWVSLAVLALAALGLGFERGLPRLETLRQSFAQRLAGTTPGAAPIAVPPPWLEPVQAHLLGGAQLLLLGLLATFSTPGYLPAALGLPLGGAILLWVWHRRPWPVTLLALQATTALWVWALLEMLNTPLLLRLAGMGFLSFAFMELARVLQRDGLRSARADIAQAPFAGLGRAGVWVSLLGFGATTLHALTRDAADSGGPPHLLPALLATLLGLAWMRWARLDRHPLVATVSVGLLTSAVGILGLYGLPALGQLELALAGLTPLLAGIALWRTWEVDNPTEGLRARLFSNGQPLPKGEHSSSSSADSHPLLPQGLFSRALWRLGWLGTWGSTLALILTVEQLNRQHPLQQLIITCLSALGLGIVGGLERSRMAAWGSALLIGAAGVGAQALSGTDGFWIPGLVATGLAGAVLAGSARWLTPSSSTEHRGLLSPGWKVSWLSMLAVLLVTGQALLEGRLPHTIAWGSAVVVTAWGILGGALTHAFWPLLATWILAGIAAGSTGFQGTVGLGVAIGMGVAALLLVARRAGALPALRTGLETLASAGDGYAGTPLAQPEGFLLRQPLQLGLLLGALYQIWGLTSPEVGTLPALSVGIAGLALTGALPPPRRPFLLLLLPALVAWQAGVSGPYCIMLISVSSLLMGGLGSHGWQKTPVHLASLLGTSGALLLAVLVSAGVGPHASASIRQALETPMLPVVLGGWTLTLGLLGHRNRMPSSYVLSALGLWATLGTGLAWLGVLLGGGRPALALLPPWGTLTVLLTLGILSAHVRLDAAGVPVQRLQRLYTVLAWASLLGAFLIEGPTPRELVLSTIGWIGLAAVSFQTGMRAQQVGSMRWAGAALILAWSVVRFFSPLAETLSPLDTHTAAVLAMVSLVAGELLLRQERSFLAKPFVEAAWVLPVIFLGVCAMEDQPLILPLAGAGALYLVHFHLRERTRALLLGLLLLNSALLLEWGVLGLTDVQLYVVPVSLTALALAQKFRTTLPRAALRALRTGALGLIFLASFYQSVLTPWSSAVMLVLALLSVGAGVGLKVRSFITLGALAVGIVLGMNLLRFGLAYPQFWALYLTLAGISILGGMVGISMQKDRLKSLLERLQSELEGWE